jgi:hypothetical protein
LTVDAAVGRKLIVEHVTPALFKFTQIKDHVPQERLQKGVKEKLRLPLLYPRSEKHPKES